MNAKLRGRTLEWDEDDLDRLAEVTPEDIARARDAWRRDAPPEYRELLDAEPEPGAAPVARATEQSTRAGRLSPRSAIMGLLLIDTPAEAVYGTAEEMKRWIAELDASAARYAGDEAIQKQLQHERAWAVKRLQERRAEGNGE